MIYTDNHLTVTLTRQPNGLFLCDKPIEEIRNYWRMELPTIQKIEVSK